MADMTSVEASFHEKMMEIFTEIRQLTKGLGDKPNGYQPSRYLSMVKNRGGVGAARELVTKYPGREQLSPALKFMVVNGRPDLPRSLAVEALVVQKPYRTLFSAEEVRIAQNKLDFLEEQMKQRRL